MSSKSFKDFVNQVASGDSLGQELKELTDADGKVSMEDVVGLAAEHGYDFTVEDISGELDDGQLDTVGGGATYLRGDPILHKSETMSTTFLKVDLNANALFFKW
jgi:predicted ribosomally synthesized peptide with nif11-like leader